MLLFDLEFEGVRLLSYDENLASSGLDEFSVGSGFEGIDAWIVRHHMLDTGRNLMRVLVLDDQESVEGIWAARLDGDTVVGEGIYRSSKLGNEHPGVMKRMLLQQVFPYLLSGGSSSYFLNPTTEDGRLFVRRLNNWDSPSVDPETRLYVLDLERIVEMGQYFSRSVKTMTDAKLLAALG